MEALALGGRELPYLLPIRTGLAWTSVYPGRDLHEKLPVAAFGQVLVDQPEDSVPQGGICRPFMGRPSKTVRRVLYQLVHALRALLCARFTPLPLRLLEADYPFFRRGGVLHEETLQIHRGLHPDIGAGVSALHDLHSPFDALGLNDHGEVGDFIAYIYRNPNHPGSPLFLLKG